MFEADSQVPLAISKIYDDAARQRGHVYRLFATAKRVERVELTPDERERFGFDAYYRCQLDSFGAPVILYTRAVPKDWALDALWTTRAAVPPCSSRCAASPPPAGDAEEHEQAGKLAGRPPLVFASLRLAWYPDNLLGRLRMDVGLFDEVSDRSTLKERECFYQLLAAVGRGADGYLEREGKKQLAEQRDIFERLADNPDLSPQQHADAARGLERAAAGASDIVPLFNQPDEQRGKLFVLTGEALRAIKIRVVDPDVVRRFDIDHYYELEIVTPDSQNNPVVCCVRKLPPHMPQGESIHENVRVSGFFLKSWAFDTHQSAGAESGEQKRRQLAPLLIAATVEVLGPPTVTRPSQSVKLAVGLAVVIVLCAGAMWYIRGADRRAGKIDGRSRCVAAANHGRRRGRIFARRLSLPLNSPLK